MKRLLVHVEGQTEEAFVNGLLASHLYGFDYGQVRARLVGNARNRIRRGGISDWNVVRKDIDRHLRGDSGALATTMVDYYALPSGWPGRLPPANLTVPGKSSHIHQKLSEDFDAFSAASQRFHPYVMMHEFEALLFSDCLTFAEAIGYDDRAEALQAVRDQFHDPEHINDSPQTAPSKRVARIVPGYDKVLFGNVAALEIGLARIRAECPSFNDWVTFLENWPAPT
ncbi:MAG: hypothetical protein CMN74_03355 [Sphingorhabdus sp.]|nr:hypothetical protein [Sphingorhabdus sp.]